MVSPSPGFKGSLFARRYVLRKKLGAGSLGAVYLAYDVETKRQVALKVIHAERLGPAAIARMQDEFRAIASLAHPQIARAYDFGYTELDGVPYYTREYIQGSPLPPGPPGREAPSRFLRPIIDLLDALDYVHDQEILHLDVHAGNLIVADQEDRGALLIDIGLREPLGGARLTTSPREWSLLPPEIVQHGSLTPGTDIYLVGRLLQFRLTGRMSGSPDLPKEIPGWGTRLTLHVERIIAKALQNAPADRFASAAELREALLAALGESEARPSPREPQGIIAGREEVLAAVEDGLRRVAAGEGVVLWLTGRTGSGKSHILLQARLAAQLRGLSTLEVGFAAAGGAAADRPRGGRSRRRLDAERHSWLEPLNPGHGGSPLERAQRAAEAYFAESSPPLVLLLDDHDHSEAESRVLVEALAAECARRSKLGRRGRGLGLFLAATGPPRRDGSSRVLGLKPLKRAEARALVLALLKPLAPSARVLERIVTRGRGIPLHLRRISRALRQEWTRAGAIPDTAEVPDCPPASPGGARDVSTLLSALEGEVVEALAILRRPAAMEELASVLGSEQKELSRAIHRLIDLELITAQGHGRTRCFQLSSGEDPASILGATPRARIREVHQRAAAFLQARPASGPGELEKLARHLMALGRWEEARSAAVGAAQGFRSRGSFDRAVRLLEDCSANETEPSARLRLAEEISDILEEAGDHERGMAVLERLSSETRLPANDRIRVQRRLGIHCHRAGYAERAQQLFEDAGRKADPRANAEDLIFIDTELAELHLFRGCLERAEEACRRGLERLARLTSASPFKGRMEVMLRASLGHIELRRLALDRARTELRKALQLSKVHSTSAERATILHNLAIAENQLNECAAAQRHFREAERMLLAAGESRNAIKIATNLAVIAAKLGDMEQASSELDRASRLLGKYPGRQLEFFFTYSRGIVALLGGQAEAAMHALERSLAQGRKLGDAHLVGYGEVYLAEAQILCGRYQKAQKRLRATARKAGASGQRLLARMAHARLQLVEALIGNEPSARRSRRVLETTPGAGFELLEAWNELFLGLGELVSGIRDDARLARALEVFLRLGVPFGARFCRLGRLLCAVAAADQGSLPRLLLEATDDRQPPHPLLDAAEALLRAVAHLELGQAESAEDWLARASSAIIGLPFLELDWSIECLRAQLALRKRDAGEARRHLHRSLHTRDLLVDMVPPGFRESFQSHPRFSPLNLAGARIQSSSAQERSTSSLWNAAAFEGMVGRSPAMLSVFQAIERLKDQDLPVLIAGETGTGKELVARALHRRSARQRGPFLAIHCASIPEELFEAELFGCAAGSYTGADEDRPGILETLGGGTAFFDDIESLTLTCQAKLLGAIDSSVIRRLGSTAPVQVDVRYLFATGVDLAAAVAEGRFRKDLYFRVRGLEIALPPLNERREDIPFLVRHFAERHARRLDRPVPTIEDSALELLRGHDWPGNVRELESLLLSAMVNLSPGGSITAAHLALQKGRREAGIAAPAPPETSRSLLARDLAAWRTDLEREYLIQLFREVQGDPEAMMDRLGVGRTRLYAWFRELGIEVKTLREELRR